MNTLLLPRRASCGWIAAVAAASLAHASRPSLRLPSDVLGGIGGGWYAALQFLPSLHRCLVFSLSLRSTGTFTPKDAQ